MSTQFVLEFIEVNLKFVVDIIRARLYRESDQGDVDIPLIFW